MAGCECRGPCIAHHDALDARAPEDRARCVSPQPETDGDAEAEAGCWLSGGSRLHNKVFKKSNERLGGYAGPGSSEVLRNNLVMSMSTSPDVETSRDRTTWPSALGVNLLRIRITAPSMRAT